MTRGFGWLAGLLMLGLLAAVGVYTYNLGMAQGLAQGMAQASAAAAAPGAVPMVPLWWRPWGFGFFPFFPFFSILFFFLILRGLFWRRRWHGSHWQERGVPPMFEEWHRRAHAGFDAQKPVSEPKA